jgi:hypothetical protein
MTLQAIDQRTPIVVVDGSGKAADVLSYVWRYLHSTEFVKMGFLIFCRLLLMSDDYSKKNNTKIDEEQRKIASLHLCSFLRAQLFLSLAVNRRLAASDQRVHQAPQ